MADRAELEPESGAEKLEVSQLKKLEKEKAPEVSKAEIEAGEKDLARRHEAAEKNLSAEKKREAEAEKKREAELEKERKDAEKIEKVEKKPPKAKPAASYTKKEKAAVYKKEVKMVQAQLPRRSRTFSKVIHNPAVEKVSDVAGKTVLRPSALIGGSVVGLAAGITVYAIARYYNYGMPNWLLPILLLLGALLGVAAELILNRFRSE